MGRCLLRVDEGDGDEEGDEESERAVEHDV